MLTHALSVQVRLSSSWPDEIDEDANGRGFAGAVGAEEAVNLPLFHGKVQILDGLYRLFAAAKGLAEILGFDCEVIGHCQGSTDSWSKLKIYVSSVQ
jgi:hypothetical protein